MLADRIRRLTALPDASVDHLRALCSAWQLLADLSFCDLLLYVPVDGEERFEVCAQVRPFTSQTVYLIDMVGARVGHSEQPIVERAFREGTVWRQEEPVLLDGVPLHMTAVPVRNADRVIAVVTREGRPGIGRRPGRLEEVYLRAADHLSDMICVGTFPPAQAQEREWPRVGDGLLLLEPSGRVAWASPNALSCLRRLGVARNVDDCYLDELGVGVTPVASALAEGRVLDGEIRRGDAHVDLRVVPLLERTTVVAALCLLRDTSELRQKERMISIRDAALREIHHRVKNNLQTIASLLRLQARRLDIAEAKAALEESVLRIGSIALVHETLSEQAAHGVDFGAVARRIATMVADGLLPAERGVRIEVRGGVGALEPSVATPLAVVLAELLQNALEHAFPDGRSGTVLVELEGADGGVVMTVSDTGVGFPASEHEPRLGLHIVRSLIDELGGTFELTAAAGTNARVRVSGRQP